MDSAVHVNIDHQALCSCSTIMCGAVIDGIDIKAGDYRTDLFMAKLREKGQDSYEVIIPGEEAPISLTVDEIEYLLVKLECACHNKEISPYSWEALTFQ